MDISTLHLETVSSRKWAAEALVVGVLASFKKPEATAC
jgi:hypothetical protein